MTHIDYKAEVLKVYPNALVKKRKADRWLYMLSPNNMFYMVFDGITCIGKQWKENKKFAWENAYNRLKEQGKL